MFKNKFYKIIINILHLQIINLLIIGKDLFYDDLSIINFSKSDAFLCATLARY